MLSGISLIKSEIESIEEAACCENFSRFTGLCLSLEKTLKGVINIKMIILITI
jgi:hypothetical protein